MEFISLSFNDFIFKVSNEVPEQAVISQVSGHIYEKRLILKYINENGTDPMNNEALSPEQLVEIKSKTINLTFNKFF